MLAVFSNWPEHFAQASSLNQLQKLAVTINLKKQLYNIQNRLQIQQDVCEQRIYL